MTNNSAGNVPAAALAVLRQFLEASERRDVEAMKTCLTQRSLASGQLDTGPQGVRFEVGEASREGEKVVVPLTAVPKVAEGNQAGSGEAGAVELPGPGAGAGVPGAMTVMCIMVEEEGEWKFDLAESMERMLGGSVEAAMGQMAEVLTKTLEGVGEAMAEGFRAAFGEEKEEEEIPAEDWTKAPRDFAAEENYALPEMETLRKTQAALTAAVGAPVLAQVALTDVMQRMGSDEREVMRKWLDEELFAGWGKIVAEIAEYLPLKGRLRALRIEAAEWHDQRMVALDGNDVVFRLHFPGQEGYYSDEWVAWTLPGVLAGLPEKVDAAAAKHRHLPQKDEAVDVDVFRARTIPRYMRQISELVGRPVGLEIDWEPHYDKAQVARALAWWGLNRVWGGLARACLDELTLAKIREELRGIRIVIESSRSERAARFVDGVLELHIDQYSGEAGGIYETELARVFDGAVIAGEEEVQGGGEAAAAEGGDEGEDEAGDEGEEAGERAEDAEEEVDEEAEEGEEDEEEAEEEEEPALGEAEQEAENFAKAVEGIAEVEPMWEQQLALALDHPVKLVVDFASLGGKFALVQPFVHEAIAGGLEAIAAIAWGDAKERDRLRAAVRKVVVRAPAAGEHGVLDLEHGVLTIRPALGGKGRRTKEAIADELRAKLARVET